MLLLLPEKNSVIREGMGRKRNIPTKKTNKTETHSDRSRLCLSSLKQQFPFLDGVRWMVFGLKHWKSF